MGRHRKRRSEIRNAGSAQETRLKDGSKWDADYADNNLKIVTGRKFPESSTSGSLKFEGDSRGTPTIIFEFFDFERVGGVCGRRADRGSR